MKVKSLILLFVLLLLINLVLFLFYKFPVYDLIIKKLYIPYGLKKSFYYDLKNNDSKDLVSKIFRLKPNEYIIIPDSITNLGSVWVRGHIKDLPYTDLKTGEIAIKIKFKGIKKSYIINTILGKNNYFINTLIGSRGRINSPLWQAYKVSDIKPKFKKGDPIILNLYYSNKDKIVQNNKDCNAECIKEWYIVFNNYKDTKNLLSALNTDQDYIINSVGPVKEIVLYDNN